MSISGVARAVHDRRIWWTTASISSLVGSTSGPHPGPRTHPDPSGRRPPPGLPPSSPNAHPPTAHRPTAHPPSARAGHRLRGHQPRGRSIARDPLRGRPRRAGPRLYAGLYAGRPAAPSVPSATRWASTLAAVGSTRGPRGVAHRHVAHSSTLRCVTEAGDQSWVEGQRLDRRIHDRGVNEDHPIRLPLQVLGHRVRTPALVGHSQDDHLQTVELRLLDGLGQVVIAGDEIDDIDDPVARIGREIQPHPQVDALLLPALREPPEPQFDAWEQADVVLVHIRHAARAPTGVIPIHAQQRQPTIRLHLLDESPDQRGVVDGDASTQRSPGDPRGRRSQEISRVDIDGAVGPHTPECVIPPSRADVPAVLQRFPRGFPRGSPVPREPAVPNNPGARQPRGPPTAGAQQPRGPLSEPGPANGRGAKPNDRRRRPT